MFQQHFGVTHHANAVVTQPEQQDDSVAIRRVRSEEPGTKSDLVSYKEKGILHRRVLTLSHLVNLALIR